MDTLKLLREGKLAGSKRLALSCGLTDFPPEIYQLADTLEILDLSGNALSGLPHDLARLHRLRVIFCSDNHFTHVPEVLGECEQLEMVGFKANRIAHLPAAALPDRLRWLILTDNCLETLPATLGQRPRLQKLMLAGNRLRHLPEEMAACHRLELLRISANRLSSLPDWLLNLPRLAWLAFAGNPFADEAEAAALARQRIPEIPWDSIELQRKLGEGASGVIHRAAWQPASDQAMPVALKLFKGAVTSDGLPASEKAACLAAGEHPRLIGVEGRLGGHPEKMRGLVMKLVDARFTNLAGPPSLESCTRDVYPEGMRFTMNHALSIAQGVASVAQHLHERGILHGDLYAHNLLWDGAGECKLGDFGAASFIPQENAAFAQRLQCIEVRAFGCLLEELLERIQPETESPEMRANLRDLLRRCMREEVTDRPLFAEIGCALGSLLQAPRDEVSVGDEVVPGGAR